MTLCGSWEQWQTRVVVPLFKKGDQRVSSNYMGITLLSLPGKEYTKVLDRGIQLIVVQVDGTSSLPSTGCFMVMEVCLTSQRIFC